MSVYLALVQHADLTCNRLILLFASPATMEETESQLSSSLAPAMVARSLRPVQAVFASLQLLANLQKRSCSAAVLTSF